MARARELVVVVTREDPRRTPAPVRERIRGSRVNAPGSASKANPKIHVPASVEKALRRKLREYEGPHKPTLGALKAVWRRGAGAFSKSHLPGMSRAGWGLKRVDAFLFLSRQGEPLRYAYVQDNDLLPRAHPRSTKGKR